MNEAGGELTCYLYASRLWELCWPGWLVSLGCTTAYTDRNTVAVFHSSSRHKSRGCWVLASSGAGHAADQDIRKPRWLWQWDHVATGGRGMLVWGLVVL